MNLIQCVTFKKKRLFIVPWLVQLNCFLFQCLELWVWSLFSWQPEVSESGKGDCSPSTLVHPLPFWALRCSHLQGWIPNNRTSLLQMQTCTRGHGSHYLLCSVHFPKHSISFNFPIFLPGLPSLFLLQTHPFSALMCFPYYVAFPTKQNLASRHIEKLLMVVWDRCEAVQNTWEIMSSWQEDRRRLYQPPNRHNRPC